MIRFSLSLMVVAGLLTGAASAKDDVALGQVGVFKAAVYTQKSATETVPTDGRPYTFEIEGTSYRDMKFEKFPTLSVVAPTSGRADALQWFRAKQLDLVYSTSYRNLSQFNLAFPFGTYTSRFALFDRKEVTQTLPIKAQDFPVVPKLKNFAALQALDPSKDFTLNWTLFKDAKKDDVITVRIIEPGSNYAVFDVGFFLLPLPATATSQTVYSGTLETGTSYILEITFIHVDLRSIKTGDAISTGSGVSTRIRIPFKTIGNSPE